MTNDILPEPRFTLEASDFNQLFLNDFLEFMHQYSKVIDDTSPPDVRYQLARLQAMADSLYWATTTTV